MRQELDITVNMFTSTAGSTEPKDDESHYSEDERDNDFEEEEDIVGVALLDSKQNTQTKKDIASPKNSNDISAENESTAILTPATTEGTISVSSIQKFQPSEKTTTEVESLLKGTGAESLYAETFYSDLTDDTYRPDVENRGAVTADKDFAISNNVSLSSQVLDASVSRSKSKDGDTDCYDDMDFEGEDSESATATGNQHAHRKDVGPIATEVEESTQQSLLPVELVEPVQVSNPPEAISAKGSSSNDDEETHYHDEYFPLEVDSYSQDDTHSDSLQRSGSLVNASTLDAQASMADPPKHNNQLESDLNEVVHTGNDRRGHRHEAEHEDYGDEDFDE